jgi:prophage regulatory protein
MKLISYNELGPQKGIRYSREHLRRLVKMRKFPAPMRLSDHKIAWIDSEIDEYVRDKADSRVAA